MTNMTPNEHAMKAEAFARRLGYSFKNPDLLGHALIHASARQSNDIQRDNERLEFLGDRVLGLVAAELLFLELPDEPEGQLARRLNRLVRKETCALMAKAMQLGDALLLSANERESGGATNDNILADACEAVLGAIFLDGGYEPARTIIKHLLKEKIGLCEKPPIDSKSALQEWAQGRGLALPRYVEVKRSGPDHDPDFIVEVQVAEMQSAQGQGKSKRAAQTEAALTFLVREGVWEQAPDV